MRNVSDKNYGVNQNTHISFNNFPASNENRSVYDLIGKNMVEPDKPEMTINHGASTLQSG
jgi:hypothetical protein